MCAGERGAWWWLNLDEPASCDGPPSSTALLPCTAPLVWVLGGPTGPQLPLPRRPPRGSYGPWDSQRHSWVWADFYSFGSKKNPVRQTILPWEKEVRESSRQGARCCLLLVSASQMSIWVKFYSVGIFGREEKLNILLHDKTWTWWSSSHPGPWCVVQCRPRETHVGDTLMLLIIWGVF